MPHSRRSYSDAEQLALTTQVEGRCPLCDKKLFYRKGGRDYKQYDLAHIYPLNPSAAELKELAGVPRLHHDVNHPDNQIPLCKLCHVNFDKPRTASEYSKLFEIKRAALNTTTQHDLQASSSLRSSIANIIAALETITGPAPQAPLTYDPKTLDAKFTDTMTAPLRRKIQHAVADSYQEIKALFLDLEHTEPNSSEIISSQIRTFYLEQKALGLGQSEIFANVVAWIVRKTRANNHDAAEVVVAYFVQNCEVFE